MINWLPQSPDGRQGAVVCLRMGSETEQTINNQHRAGGSLLECGGPLSSCVACAYGRAWCTDLSLPLFESTADCPDAVPSSAETGGTNYLAPGGLSGKMPSLIFLTIPRFLEMAGV